MLSQHQLAFEDYWLILRRRKWLLILPVLPICAGAALYAFSLPDIYRASTLILVEAQKIPESYVQSTVSAPVSERLRTITQQIKSRTRLEQVARELNLLSNLQDRRTIDDYLNQMIKRIEISVQGPGNDGFSVSYEERDPHTVMLVVNKLASLFIEANLQVRGQQVASTTEFLEGELLRVRDLLQTQEQALSEYKQRYMGEMPAQQEAHQRTLANLQAQLRSTLEELESIQSRRSATLSSPALSESEVAPSLSSGNTESPFASNPSPGNTGPAVAPNPNPGGALISDDVLALSQQLAQRRQALAELQQVHTDKYPDVHRLKQGIAELEAQIAAKSALSPSPGRPQTAEAPAKSTFGASPGNIFKEIYQISQSRIGADEKKLRQQQKSLQEQIATYEKKVSNTVRSEKELMILTRDYESTRKAYDSLLARRMQAQVAQRLEIQQQSEQFRVLDPARLPTKPWKPNRFRILLMGLGAGLAMGAGAVLLVECLDNSFRNPEELEHFTNLPVLATVPLLITDADEHKQRLKTRLLCAVSVFVPTAALAVVHLFWIRLELLFTRTLQLLNF